ncbi:MAG: hypothetical protein HY646_20710, partial [Acidobacteria bacterium]|nr:hypothetical protein [Acidobacteriota bacterium]
MRQTVLPLCVSAIVILFISPPAAAQQVGARQYTVADGLADNFIEALLEDSHGYIWFATREGLSRFDGYSFKNYTTADGLPGSWIRDVAEDSHGNIWVATSRGMVRLVDDGFPNARAPVRFDPAPGLENRDAHPGALIAQLGGWIWGLAAGGIFRGKPDAGGKAVFERFSTENSGLADPRLFRDREARLWIMLDHVLVVLAPDGRELARYGPEHGIGRNWIVSVAQDRSGRIYAANQFELFRLQPGPESGSYWQKLPFHLQSATSEMRWLAFDLSNRLWIGTTRGVMWWQDGITTELSLSPGPASWVEVGLVDRHGNVWIGTHGQGVFRVPSEPILSLNERHGLPPGTVTHIIEDVDGRIYATSELSGLVEVTAGRILP